MTAEPPRNGLALILEDRRLQVEAALRRLHVHGRAPEVEAAIEHSLFAPAFVAFAGVEGARRIASELVNASVAALSRLGPSAARLRALAPQVLERTR